jgi:DNA polymerase-3 subunit beta
MKDGRMMATDLENTVTLTVSEVQGAFLLPCRAVTELLKYVPGDEMLTLDSEGKKIKLSWKGGSAAYEVKEVQDFPETPRLEFKAEGHLNGDALIEALLSALPYCATESARPVLTGVTLYLGTVLQVAAADGFRLSYQSLKQSYPVQQTLILPATTAKVLEYLWEKMPARVPLESDLIRQLMAIREIKFSLAEGIADFQFGSIRLTSKLISGTAPDHLALLNNFREPIKVKLLAPELRNAVRRLAGIAKDSTGIVRLKWTESAMTVSARSEEVGEVNADIPVQPESIPGKVALNVKYLLDYLEGKEGLITLGKDEGASPALFHYGTKPVVAIMPMQVKWEEDQPVSEEPKAETTASPAGDAGENPVSASEEDVTGEAETGEENPEQPILESLGQDGTIVEYQDEESSVQPDPQPVAAGVKAIESSPEKPTEPEVTKTSEKRRSRRKKT